MTAFHIRSRVKPRGGNSFYKDKSERTVTTLCGENPTEYDCVLSETKRIKEKFNPFTNRPICEACYRKWHSCQTVA